MHYPNFNFELRTNHRKNYDKLNLDYGSLCQVYSKIIHEGLRNLNPYNP